MYIYVLTEQITRTLDQKRVWIDRGQQNTNRDIRYRRG